MHSFKCFFNISADFFNLSSSSLFKDISITCFIPFLLTIDGTARYISLIPYCPSNKLDTVKIEFSSLNIASTILFTARPIAK